MIRVSVLILSALFVIQGLTAACRTSVASQTWKHIVLIPVKFICFRASLKTKLVIHFLAQVLYFIIHLSFANFFLTTAEYTIHGCWGRGKGYFLNAYIQTTKDVGLTFLVNFSYGSNHCQSKHIVMEEIKICCCYCRERWFINWDSSVWCNASLLALLMDHIR